jgi:hypothetical protein
MPSTALLLAGEKLMRREIAIGALLATFGVAGILSAQRPAGISPAPPVKRNFLERTDVLRTKPLISPVN